MTIKDDNIESQQMVLLIDLAYWENTFQATKIQLPMQLSHDNAVIALPVLSISRNTTVPMAPPLHKCNNLTLVNILYKSNHAPRKMFPLYKCSGEHNIPQPHDSGDQSVFKN